MAPAKNCMSHASVSKTEKGVPRMKTNHSLTIASVTAALLLSVVMVEAATIVSVIPSQNRSVEGDGSSSIIRARPNQTSGRDFASKAWMQFDLDGYDAFPDEPATFTITFRDTLVGGNDDTNWEVRVFGLDAGFTPDETNELGIGWSESDFDGSATDWDRASANLQSDDISFESANTTLLGAFDLDTNNNNQIDAAEKDIA
jgi:hypothetical protein